MHRGTGAQASAPSSDSCLPLSLPPPQSRAFPPSAHHQRAPGPRAWPVSEPIPRHTWRTVESGLPVRPRFRPGPARLQSKGSHPSHFLASAPWLVLAYSFLSLLFLAHSIRGVKRPRREVRERSILFNSSDTYRGPTACEALSRLREVDKSD